MQTCMTQRCGVASTARHAFAKQFNGVALPRAVVARKATVAAAAPLRVVAATPQAVDAENKVARAHLNFQRGAPSKVRRVLDQIRGRSYEDALAILEYMPYRACEPIQKTLLSAAANAKNNLGLRKSKLYVCECYCDEGPVMKRFRPRAQGRADRILKPTNHITVKVAEMPEDEE